MSAIEKLLIRGIRSFNPDDEATVINFFAPLTLICGHNGSGKTTIIECLKYATTGDMPPNSKGGAFVHDPKIAGEIDVKAQVKLQFKSASGQVMVCMRSMQLSQKKTNSTFKTLETLLQTIDKVTGESVTLTGRCADMDVEIPQFLGINRAILENVIFCHQEESNWPLSEPSILKKKFDEIFEATRYTKALQNIKELRKTHKEQINLDKQVLAHLKENKDKAERARLVELEAEVTQAGNDIRGISDRLSEILRIENYLKDIETKKTELEKQTQLMQIRLQSMQEPDEVLKKVLSDLEEESGNLEEKREDLLRRRGLEDENVTRISDQKSKMLTEKGRLQAEMSAQERRIADRNQLVTELASKHSIPGFQSGSLTQQDVSRFQSKLDTELAELDRKNEEYRRIMKGNEEGFLKDLGLVSNKIVELQERRNGTRKLMETNATKSRQNRDALEKLSTSDQEIARLDFKLREDEELLKTAQDCLKALNVDSSLRELARHLQGEERVAAEKQREFARMTGQGDTRAKLSFKKTERARRAEQVQRTLDAIPIDFGELLEQAPTIETIERVAEGVVRQKDQQVKDSEQRLNKSQQDLSAWETKLSLGRSTLEKKERDLEEKRSALFEVIGQNDYGAIARTTEALVSERTEDAGALKGADKLYAGFVKKFKDKHACPLCNRGFSDKTSEEKFMKTLEVRAQRLPVEYESAVASLHEIEQRMSRIRALAKVDQDITALDTTEIPEERLRVEEATEQKSLCVDIVEQATFALRDAQRNQESAHSLQKTASEIVRLGQEISLLDKEIFSLAQDLASSGSTKTVEDVRIELDRANDSCKSLRRLMDGLNAEAREKQYEIQNFAERLQATKNRLTLVHQERLDWERLTRESTELREENSRLEKELREIESKMEEQRPRQVQLEQLLESHRNNMTARESDVMSAFTNLQQSGDRLKSIEREIRRFNESGSEQLLKTADSTLKSFDNQLESHQQTIRTLTEQLTTLDKKKTDDQLMLRRIEDNLQFRRLKEELRLRCSELVEANREYRKVDKRTFEQQYIQLKKRQDELFEERAGNAGQVKQLEERRKQLIRELEADYKDVEEKYRAQLIKLKTEQMADTDLDKYSKALDNAIMKYHSAKMEEINRNIQELWVNTYQGNGEVKNANLSAHRILKHIVEDIDTIRIRSDNDAKGNRTYSYRVVMVKDQTELDMRGSFGVNCGILALDEPTTNLDRANVESLAQSLVNIIQHRRQQANFQLIVITHDEEFMSHIGRSEFADFYYRVEKDDRGRSHVLKEVIQKV